MLPSAYLAQKLTPYPLPTKDGGVLRTVGDAHAYIMEVKKDENGNLKATLKDTAIKDWQDPYHQECPMKW